MISTKSKYWEFKTFLLNFAKNNVFMKKIIPFLLLVFLVSQLNAQEKAFQFGFKLGPSIGWIKPSSDGYERDGARASFNWGFMGDINIMENYAVHTGFNVIYLNGAYTYPDKKKLEGAQDFTIGTTNRVLHLKYIEIPALMRMKTDELGEFTFYGEAGFGLGFNTGAKADDTFIADNTSATEKGINVNKQVKFSRFAMILGAGAYYSLGGSSKLMAGIRFNNNLFDVLKDQNPVDPKIDNKAIGNFLELQLGFLF